MELNVVVLIGNLTRDPEMRHTQSGTAVCGFGIASNRRWGSGENKQESVLYIDVDCWGKCAENCDKYLQKGQQVVVRGRLELDQWTDRDGGKRSKIKIVADDVQFGAKPKDARDRDSGDGGGEYEY